jgi:hypothetical protein
LAPKAGGGVRGFAAKVARLWQLIVLPRSIVEEYIVCRSAVELDLHPAGLEPPIL